MAGGVSRDLRERVFLFSCAVVTFSRELSSEPGVVRAIAWQLADAARSAGAYLEEARAAYSRRDFASKNSLSLKEARELTSGMKRLRLVGVLLLAALMACVVAWWNSVLSSQF